MLVGKRIEFYQLFICDDVTRRVSWPGDADHPGLFTNMQMFEIYVILELTLWQQLNIGTRRDEQILFQPGIRIADIFRCEREQYLFGGPISAAACKEVKQVEKRTLTAIC